jgi:hypothetical protein
VIISAACALILAGSIILSPEMVNQDALRPGDRLLPFVCQFRSLTGLPCPGCGLTRSLVAAGHLDPASSLAYHRLGPATWIYLLFQFLLRSFLIYRPHPGPLLKKWIRRLDAGLIGLAFLFGVNWIFTLAFPHL